MKALLGLVAAIVVIMLGRGIHTQAQSPAVHYQLFEFQFGLPGATTVRTGPLNNFQHALAYYTLSTRPYRRWLKIDFDGGGLPRATPLELPASLREQLGLIPAHLEPYGDPLWFYGLNDFGESVGCVTGARVDGFLWDGRTSGDLSNSFHRITAVVPGWTSAGTCPMAVNNLRQMVGRADVPSWFDFFYDPAKGPVLGFTNVPQLGNGTNATALNQNGDYTGHFTDSNHRVRGFIKTARGISIIDDTRIYANGQLTALASYATFPSAINVNGDVVGNFIVGTGSCLLGAQGCRRAFVYRNGEFHIIAPDLPPSLSVYVTGINDKGVIFGSYEGYDDSRQFRSSFFFGVPSAAPGFALLTRERLLQSIRSAPPTAANSVSLDSMTQADFDGDGRSDRLHVDRANGRWYLNLANGSDPEMIGIPWGWRWAGMHAGHQLALGDYDGDAKTDRAIVSVSTGQWLVIPSSQPDLRGLPEIPWGWTWYGMGPQHTLALGDYDGDGRTDRAIVEMATGRWYIIPSGNPEQRGTSDVPWGWQWAGMGSGHTLALGDYDGDQRTDRAIVRMDTGQWVRHCELPPGPARLTRHPVGLAVAVVALRRRAGARGLRRRR